MKEQLRGLLVQAHPDDRALAAAVDIVLINAGVELNVITLTDGAGRDLPGFGDNRDLLRDVREGEDQKSIDFIGGRLLNKKKLPDSRLAEYRQDGAILLSSAIDQVKPDFLITPHTKDIHIDHSTSAEIALSVAEVPIYLMPTATGTAKDGHIIEPTHVVPVSLREVRKGIRAFRMHISQTENLPHGEIKDVFDVMAMPRIIGNENGYPYASALTLVDFSLGDPIREVLGEKSVVLKHRRFVARV